MSELPLGESFPASRRTRVRRMPDRGVYERALIHAILDAGIVCHVGYTFDGVPHVTPTAYWREDDMIYWHGSSASRMLRAQRSGIPVCLTVTHLDGLVLARSAFNHSMNYRSVMAFGSAAVVDDDQAKTLALRAFTERLVPGRWNVIRMPTAQELKATTVLRMPLDEVSAKVRSGPPIDDEEDYASACWAGVLPLALGKGRPIPDPRLPAGMEVPAGLRDIRV